MKLILLSDGIWPYVLGGMQKHSYYICKYLAKKGVQVHLVHYNQSAYDILKLEWFTEEEKKNISQTVLDFPKSPRFPGHYLYNSYRYSKRAFEAIKDRLSDSDFIYSKGFSAWYLLNQKKRGLPMPPVGVKFHGYEMFQPAPDWKTGLQMRLLLRLPVRKISSAADYVFSYGGGITDLIRGIGVEANRIIELPSGIESQQVSEQVTDYHKPLRFIFLGRYERRKGIEELNAAIRDVLNKGQRAFELHVVGPIPEQKQMRLSQLFYHGEVRDRHKLTELLRSCDVLLCPSWSEGFPNVLLEAMGAGLTVLATRVGAVSVLVNEQAGFMVDKPEPRLLAEALQKILECKASELQKKKAQALQRIKNNFTWEVLADRLLLELEQRVSR